MKTTEDNEPVTPEQKRYIASELNLARLPYFASSTTNAQKRKSLEYKRVIQQDGGELAIEWKVTADAEYGYPGPFAEAVHATLLDIVTERGLPFENPVTFSFYNICNRLEIPPSGKNTTDIRRAVRSIRSANIWVDNAFIDKDGHRQSFYRDPVNLYDRYIGYDEFDPETEERADINKVWLADFYLESLNSGNIRPIDFEYFKYLHKRSYVATKIYKHLGYRFAGTFKHNNSYAKVDYDDLVSIADVKRRQYLSRIKQQFSRAHEALGESAFIQKIDWKKEKQTGGPNKFFIHYYPGDRAREEYRNGRLAINRQCEFPLLGADTERSEEEKDLREAMQQASTTSNTSKPLAHELEALGVSHEQAKELDREYSEERITHQLDHLEYLSERGKTPDNVAGWLVSAIREGYETPDGLKTREERKAEKRARQKAAERKRRKEEKEQRERQKEKEHRQLIADRLAALSEEVQEEIEDAAIERLKEEHESLIRTVYTGQESELKESQMFKGEYYDYLEELLDEREEST